MKRSLGEKEVYPAQTVCHFDVGKPVPQVVLFTRITLLYYVDAIIITDLRCATKSWRSPVWDTSTARSIVHSYNSLKVLDAALETCPMARLDELILHNYVVNIIVM